MKILYVSQYFPPEMGAPAARASELSRHWARMGHEVTVLTGFPNHPTGVVPRDWRARFHHIRWSEIVDGVRVVRTWLWPLPNRKAHERIRNYSSFCFSAGVTGLTLETPDVVIGTSPQLLCALAGWWIAFAKRVPFVFEVRDLWPESLTAVGASDERSVLHRTLGAIAGFLYRRADRIVIVSPAFRERLVKFWNVPDEKISVIENGVETDLFRFDVQTSQVRKQHGLEGRFLICYIGTMGNAHGLEMLLATAEQLQSVMPKAMFLLIGEGAEKANLVGLAAKRKLANIKFLGEQPRERIPAYVSAADVCLVLLKKTELFKTVIPTKLLEYMACERAVIVGVDGETRRIVEQSGAGVFVEPENSMALVKAILDLAKEPESRARMGVRARQYIVRNLSRQKTAQDYLRILGDLAPRSRTAEILVEGAEDTIPRTGT